MQTEIGSEELFQRLARLNEIGVALSAKEDLTEIMEMILMGAKELTNADAGTLYIATDSNSLRFAIVRTDSLGMAWGGVGQEPVPFPDVPLYDDQGKPNEQMVVCYCALHGETLNIADAYDIQEFNFSGTRQFDEKTGYRSKSFLNVPLKNHRKEVIGVLQLLNRLDPATGEVVAFSHADERLTESLGSQAAVALSNRQLIGSLNDMLTGFIEAIASGIDQQSAYTGDHCRRVPIVSDMLARAVNRAEDGPFADFTFTKEELHELHFSALLHDCGKVATPIHITDKSTRQETVIDGIDHIRTRFELKKKEAQLLGEADLSRYDDDFAFLEECNRATTFMSDERKERVRTISKETWRDSEGQEHPILTPQELTNFLITRGTLNDEEREIINNHVVSSIKMLENLSYPRHLKRVPEIAGAHHEWMNGNGYPRGIKGDEMSLQARILCVADVFEALTAHDRPYKPPMPLSKVLMILQQMVERGHLDGDLIETLIQEEVHLAYAKEHLREDQMDL